VTINEHDRHKAVIEGMELAADLITRSAIIETLYLDSDSNSSTPVDQLRKALLKLYTQILRFLSDAVRHYSKSGLARYGSSIINPAETTLQRRIADMVREQVVVDSLTHYVQRSSFINATDQAIESTATLQRMLDSMQNPIDEIHNGVQELLAREEQLNHHMYLDWLSPLPYAQLHADIRSDRIQDTGQWLMQTYRFRGWRYSTTSSLFWLQGLPGCGKTRLTSAVIDNIKTEEIPPDQQLPLAYVYFARDTAEKQRGNPTEALRSLARQLCASLNRSESLTDLYSTQKLVNASSDIPPRLSNAEALEYILEMTADTTTYLILDAMDECVGTRRDEMIRNLSSLLEAPDRIFRIFISSRDPIPRRLAMHFKLEISPEDNFQDIERFINTKVDEHIMEGRLLQGHVSEELKHLIVSNLKEKSQGMCVKSQLNPDLLSVLIHEQVLVG
jgi:Cdc6-like AAA superfamily ATPase